MLTISPTTQRHRLSRSRRGPIAIAAAAIATALALLLSSFAAVPQAAAFEPEAVQLDCSIWVGAPGVIDLAAGGLPTEGSDIILGTPGDDVIAAAGGDDLICGQGGNDTIWGQDGNDVIIGGPGDDKLRGGNGDDVLFGRDGADDLNGGRGNDVVMGQGGDDLKLRGGTGDDYITGAGGNDALIAGNGGSDFLAGGDGDEGLISGGPRPDQLHGGAGNDLLKGLGGADRIFGDAGDDELRGGEQPDLVDGGSGTDLCNGGLKDDRGMNCETWETVESEVPDPLLYTSTQPATCPIELPEGFPAAFLPECTIVTVPEDDTNPANGRTIDLMVAYVNNGRAPGGAPIVNLDGGPGGSSLDSAPFWRPEVNGFPYDIVFYDQRGIGDSSPSLDCVEVDNAFGEISAAGPEMAQMIETAALEACSARLQAQGVNFGMFNSEQHADDLELIRRAMGFQPWVLWGTSYGARLGLTSARDHPEGIRGMIIDAILPIEVDAFGTIDPNFDEVLDHLVASCAAQVACANAYGDLAALIDQAVAVLNANPQTIMVDVGEARPVPIFVDGDRFLRGFIFNLMYITEFVPEVPRWISLAAQGDVNEITNLIAPFFQPTNFEFSEGMFQATMCQDEAIVIPFNSPEMVDGCTNFTADADQTFDKTPASSSVPTVVFSGGFDPITPPKWGRQVADALGNATFAEFTVQGHGAGGGCFISIFEMFVADPGAPLDVSCADEGLPNFNTGSQPFLPASSGRNDPTASWADQEIRMPMLGRSWLAE